MNFSIASSALVALIAATLVYASEEAGLLRATHDRNFAATGGLRPYEKELLDEIYLLSRRLDQQDTELRELRRNRGDRRLRSSEQSSDLGPLEQCLSVEREGGVLHLYANTECELHLGIVNGDNLSLPPTATLIEGSDNTAQDVDDVVGAINVAEATETNSLFNPVVSNENGNRRLQTSYEVCLEPNHFYCQDDILTALGLTKTHLNSLKAFLEGNGVAIGALINDPAVVYNVITTLDAWNEINEDLIMALFNLDETDPQIQALVALFASTNGVGWDDNDKWLVDSNFCNWFGVVCNIDGDVESLSFDKNNLSGTLPDEIGFLSSLEYLSLRESALSGPIPSSIGQLSNLRIFNIIGSGIEGPIPTEIGDLSSLENFYINDNLDLSGEIPVTIGDLSSLKQLHIERTMLSGTIPSQIGKLQYIEQISLMRNQLSGQIPSQFGLLYNLKSLSITSQPISGTMPPAFGELSSLTYLDLTDTELSGTLPPELGDLSLLGVLFISGTELSGTIPKSFGELGHLSHVYVHNTPLLVGQFPNEFCNLFDPPGNLTEIVTHIGSPARIQIRSSEECKCAELPYLERCVE